MCPSCGYFAGDISEGDERIRAVVDSDIYQAQFKDPQRPSRMQLGALLVDPRDEYCLEERCYWNLWGAWTSKSGDAVVLSRRLAMAALGRVIEAGSQYFEMAGKDLVVMADLHRRCGEFDEAAEWVSRGLACDCDKEARRQLALEQSFIKARDTGPHDKWDKPVEPPQETPETPALSAFDGKAPL